MSERIALLIDGENLHSTAKNLGFEIDFKLLLQEFEALGTIVRAYFYTRVRDDDANTVRPLIDWLNYNGFTVKTRPVKEHDNGEDRRRIKRSIGVDLAVDAWKLRVTSTIFSCSQVTVIFGDLLKAFSDQVLELPLSQAFGQHHPW